VTGEKADRGEHVGECATAVAGDATALAEASGTGGADVDGSPGPSPVRLTVMWS
jgi:hypothetical protein